MNNKVIDIFNGEPLEISSQRKNTEFEKVRQKSIEVLSEMIKDIQNANENDKISIFGMKISQKIISPFLISLGGKSDILEIIGGCELLKESMLDHLMSPEEPIDDAS